MLTEDQKQRNREDYKKKRKKQAVIVWVILGLLFFLLFFGKYIWGIVGFYIPYSEGERVGTIVKLSNKGLIWKTWEGEMVVRRGYISYGDFWRFSIDNNDPQKDELVSDVWDAFNNGYTVQISYEQKAGIHVWRGKTAYLIKEVKIVEYN
ncbi:MAG TPA: hypothetical protein VJH92_05890 [Candidatus Nanoarchaeia archaeon]|nr:hypothetical protein [Candidatus Nanoarchaeia archaeon]